MRSGQRPGFPPLPQEPASQVRGSSAPLAGLAKLYGRAELLGAVSRALELMTYDAAYVENLLLAERRRRQLPTPTLPAPQQRELIDDIDLRPLIQRFMTVSATTLRGTPMARRDDSLQARLERDWPS